MTAPKISDHALLRLLVKGSGLDLEGLREAMAESLERAHTAARSVSTSDYLVRADGLLFVVRGETVVTVVDDRGPSKSAKVIVNTQDHPTE